MSRILVVDDDEDIRLLLRLELAPEGHQVIEAPDGARAVELLRAAPIDLVLLDVMMPVLDGWGVLAALEGDAPPVVAVTALGSLGGAHVGELLRAGAIEVIAKPFDPDHLVALCGELAGIAPDEADRRRRVRLAELG